MKNTEQSPGASRTESFDYCRLKEVAAPHAGQSLYLNHPVLGWVPILDQFADIERDRVVIAIGSPDSGAFKMLLDTFYSECADLILDAATAKDIFPDLLREGKFEPADDIVAELPSATPGESNLTALREGSL
jgi:hypothetical protein